MPDLASVTSAAEAYGQQCAIDAVQPVQQQLSTAQAANAALTQQCAQLTAQLAQLRARTLWGSTFAKGATVLEAALGPLQIGRFYSGKGLTTALNAGAKNGWPGSLAGVFSAKYGTPDPKSNRVNITDCLDGRYNAEFDAACDKLGSNDRACVWHEHNVKISDGVFTLDDYLTSWRYFVGRARSRGCKAKWVQIWSDPTLHGGTLDQYVGDDWCDEVAIDPYSWTVGQTALEKVGPIIDALRTVTQKPVGVAEIGCYYAGADRTAFVQSLGALAGRVAFCCWYSDSNTAHGDFSIDGIPEAASAYRTLVQMGAA